MYDWKLLDYLKQADWIVDLNPRPLMGLFASFAGSRCIQWSGFDIPPNSDEYSAARRHLIPFPKEGLVSAHAAEIAEHIVRHLTLPFNDDLDRNKGAGAYNKRLSAFSNAINKMLGVVIDCFATNALLYELLAESFESGRRELRDGLLAVKLMKRAEDKSKTLPHAFRIVDFSVGVVQEQNDELLDE